MKKKRDEQYGIKLLTGMPIGQLIENLNYSLFRLFNCYFIGV